MKKGDEVFAVLDETVLSVSLARADKQVVASRRSGKEPFRFRFVSDGRTEPCGSTPALEAALRQTFSIRALEVYDGDAVERLAKLPAAERIELEVKSAGQPPEPFTLSLAAPRGAAVTSRVDAYLREHEVGFAVECSRDRSAAAFVRDGELRRGGGAFLGFATLSSEAPVL